MEYNYVQYRKAVQKALKEFDKQAKGNKMPKSVGSNPTAPMTTYPKGKKPKKK